MKRRAFLTNSVLSAIAVSTTGFIRFDGKKYVGDCETTSDILGPFYRPDSPVRSSLVIKGEKGELTMLVGKIKHDDCTTPYKNAKIEIWHCDGHGVYDNETPAFKYRGTTYSDKNGNYAFQTILPVPYDTGDGNFRPAHFHMMITAEGYQPLVTQLYFNGDKHIAKDESASLPTAKRRILKVQNGEKGTKKVVYDVSMSKKLLVEPPVLGLLAGTYIDEKDPNKKTELLTKDHQLWIKGDKQNGMPFGLNLEYVGDNTFSMHGVPVETLSFQFEVLHYGIIKMKEISKNDKGKKKISVSVRQM
jgi:catechol 1,2-dioxygenase